MKTIWVCQVPGCTNELKATNGRICQAHQSRMRRHGTYEILPTWRNLKKGLPWLTNYGYLRINVEGERVLQHRYIMEQHLGRSLTKNERVHHINGDRTDNRIENLELFSSHGQHYSERHGQNWRKRKVNPPHTEEDIQQMNARVALGPYAYDRCFCGEVYFAKNLCPRHYAWAHKHLNYARRQIKH